MGCDIHIYAEYKKKGSDHWIGAGKLDRSRNYDLFGVIAGVRLYHEASQQFEPRGLPDDSSEYVRDIYRAWESDAHSESHLGLEEIRELMEGGKAITISGLHSPEQSEKIKAGIAAGKVDWKNLYPYCQGTTDETYVPFSFEVPFDFIIGKQINSWIWELGSLLDYAGEGAEARAVFWFDN